MTSIWNSGKTNKASCKACSTALIILFSTVHHVTLLFTTPLFSFNIFTRNQWNCREPTFVPVPSWYLLSALLRIRMPAAVEATGTRRSRRAGSRHAVRLEVKPGQSLLEPGTFSEPKRPARGWAPLWGWRCLLEEHVATLLLGRTCLCCLFFPSFLLGKQST